MYLESSPIQELAVFNRGDSQYISKCVPYKGNPRKHPYDEEKILLIQDPFSEGTAFYEFRLDDIRHVDEQPNLVTEEGRSLKMVELWVLKGSRALQYEPFHVE